MIIKMQIKLNKLLTIGALIFSFEFVNSDDTNNVDN